MDCSHHGLKLPVSHFDVLSVRPITTGHHSTRNKNSFISRGCRKVEMGIHAVRSSAYLTIVFSVEDGR